jgi:arginase
MEHQMNVQLICSPYDSGRRGERNGAGPAALSDALRGRAERVEEIELTGYLAEISVAFGVARELSARVRDCLAKGAFPIVLSGNCCASLGTISGCGCANTDVVWFDGHGEGMTPDTTSSGFLDGMGISVLTGRAWQTIAGSIPGFAPIPGKQIVLAGGHDCEPAELALLDEVGVERVRSVAALKDSKVLNQHVLDGIYVHLDLDVLDSREAMASVWATPGGWNVDDLVEAIRIVKERRRIKAVGVASYDPQADRDGRAAQAIVRIIDLITT